MNSLSRRLVHASSGADCMAAGSASVAVLASSACREPDAVRPFPVRIGGEIQTISNFAMHSEKHLLAVRARVPHQGRTVSLIPRA